MAESTLANVSIQAISICVQYSDYLACVLPSWLRVFDRITIVTGPDDRDTQHLCRQYGVDCHPTAVFWSANACDFYKGRGYREAMKQCVNLRPTDWMVHIDSDMYLPPETIGLVRQGMFDDRKFYGFERRMCHTPSDWSKYLKTGETSQFTKPNERFEHLGVIGFFQLFNWGRCGQLWPKGYPAVSNDAGLDDVRFPVPWGKPRVGQVWHPQHKLYHLGSPLKNWQGRCTPPFHVLSQVVYAMAVLTDPEQLPRVRERCLGADRIWLFGNTDAAWWKAAAIELGAVPICLPDCVPNRSFEGWLRLLEHVPLVPDAIYHWIGPPSNSGELDEHEVLHDEVCTHLKRRPSAVAKSA